MKNVAFLLALCSVFFFTANVKAQSTYGTGVTLPVVAGDTIVNTGTVTKALPAITAGFQGIYIQALLSKISGTGAGTVQMQISMDNVNWVNSGSAYTITNVATQVGLFSLAYPLPVYVRLLYTGSGTESVRTVTSYVIRRDAVKIVQ